MQFFSLYRYYSKTNVPIELFFTDLRRWNNVKPTLIQRQVSAGLFILLFILLIISCNQSLRITLRTDKTVD